MLVQPLLDAIATCELIDLSRDVSTPRPHGPFQTRMEVLEAEPGASFFTDTLLPKHFPEGVGVVRPESFPGARFLRHEMVTLSTHAGSHVDAPGHYGGPLGAGSFIDEAPPGHFIGPGLCVDGTNVEGDEVRWCDVLAAVRRHGVDDLAGHIVLIRTGNDKAVAADAVREMVDRDVALVGTDADSLDGPYLRMLRRYVATRDGGALWPCHMLGRDRPFYHYENLANLDRLPEYDFLVWGPPVVVGGATASWARVLALVPKNGGPSHA